MGTEAKYTVDIDSGGTMTDCLIAGGGALHALKLDTTPHDPGNCFYGNTDPRGLSSDPPNIQSPPFNQCGVPNGSSDPVLTSELLCATQLVFPCPGLPDAHYPRTTQVRLMPVPPEPAMPDPCVGVPANPWCPA